MNMKSTAEQIQVRPYAELPAVDIGWLALRDHFIATVGPHSGRGEPLKDLLVLADAKMQPKTSFPKHPHEDMEILTWVSEGTLHHQDNKGSDQFVPALSLQLMSARDGIFHAEGNSSDQVLRLFQIWIQPTSMGGTPEVRFETLQDSGFQLMAGPKDAPLVIRQNLWLYAARVSEAQEFEIPPGQFGYAVLIGNLTLNQQNLFDGDGAILPAGKHRFSGQGQVLLILQNN